MIPKRKGTHFLVILALILLLGNYLQVNAQPTITSISTSLSSIVGATGSIEGGTYVYIKGSGFSTEASQNIVRIGPYPCKLLADGAKQNGLSCQTTKAFDPTQRWSLPVSVEVQGYPKVTCTSTPCRFTYQQGRTPSIEEIFPRTALGDQQISIWGRHRITDPGDQRSNGAGQIRNLFVDDVVCSTLDIVQQDTVNADYRDYLRCKTFKDHEAGEYTFTEHVHPGYARLEVRTLQTSLFTGKNYTQRIAPRISSLPYHLGGNKGHQIEIKGTGFSKDPSKYECSIAGETCTIKDINPTKVTVVVPPLSGGNTLYGALTKDVSDSQTQQGKFLGSNGFRYTRYSITDKWSTADYFDVLRGNHGLVVLADEIRTELRSPQSNEGLYLQHWRGYFYAPKDGVYRFAGIADDAFRVKFSSVKSSSNLANLQDFIYNDYTYDDFNPYLNGAPSAVGNKTLTEGYYYMQIISINYGGAGDFRILVDMPQIHDQTANPTWQVDEFTILPDAITPEILEIKITKASMGVDTAFSISYFESSTVSYSTNIDYGATADTFKWQLRHLPYYANYNPTVTLITKDSAGVETSTAADIASYTYRLQYQRYRNPITLLREFYSAKATFTRVQNHSKPITGTYSIKVGTSDLALYSSTNRNFSVINIPFNTQWWTLQDAFNAIYQTDKIQVRSMQNNDFDESIKFVVEYVGVLGDPLPLTIDTANLLGGNADVFVPSYTIKRQFSLTRPLYSPLPYEFLRTAQNLPQLYLTVNKIPALCSDCSYEFDAAKTASLTTATLSTDTLTLSITDSGSVGFGLSDLIITLNGERCNQLTGDLTSLTCKFNQNSQGNAALPAGSNKPKVHIAQVGFADNSAVTAITVPLTITSITPSISGSNGGLQGRIVGFGFPTGQKEQVSLSLCGNQVTEFKSVSNELIVFIIPKGVTACTTGSSARLLQTVVSTLTIGSSSQQITTTNFNYDASIVPVISSLSKTSSSPIVKSTLIITGTGFSNLAGTKVFLVNSTGFRSYELTVVSVSSTSIQCILGGGRTGTYNVVVLDATSGQSSITANTVFNYELIVESVSPVSGSLGGGYDITITGRNFGEKDTHTVFVGDGQNAICVMKSATATQIVCTVPRMHSTYTVGTPVNVIVTARLTQESRCSGSCGFTYDDSVTNNVTVPAVLEYAAGAPVTISGSDLTNAVVMVGGVTVTLLTSTPTELSFNYPALPAGSYEVKIMTPTGYTHPEIMTTTALSFGTLSRVSGSWNGHRLTLTGNGFPSTINDRLAVNMICANYSERLRVFEMIPNRITFETIPSLSDQQCKLNFTFMTTFKTINYNYMATQTFNSTVTQSGDTHTVTSTATVDSVWFQYINSENTPTSTLYPGTVTKTGMSTYSVVPTGGYLSNGKYRVLVHGTNVGYHNVHPATFDKNWASNPTFTAVESSFIGGKQLTLTGAGFLTERRENNQILVCGLRSRIKTATQTSLTLQVPPLITTVTQGLYNLAKPSTITGALFSDNPLRASNILDGKVATVYTSTNAACFIGFNFGSNAKADISYIKYMPNPAWPIAAEKLEGAKFEGSNNNSTWTTIFDIDTQQVHSGWNFWAKPQGATVQYQYIRFTHTDVSKCELSEIQFNGIVYSTLDVVAGTDKSCDIVIKGPTDVTLSNAVTYAHSKTSTVTNVSPSFGSSIGGTTITITGTNFGSALSVKIDGIDCAISAADSTSTQIKCVTGRRSTIPPSNSFVVISDGNPVLIQSQPFAYIDRWSSQDTWGGESIPRQGDSVYVPKGMSLLVDVPSTPILDSIIVEGRIVFADQIDMTLDAHYFIISGGEFVAGTESKRYQNKLTITLHGGYYDKQLPIFGNKVLGCRNCKFSLHGKVRNPTWTQLDATIAVGATQFTVLDAVDWQAGQSIVVASSSFDHYEAQQRTIASVSADGKTITVTEPFKYRHYAAVQTYDGVEFPMRAEVGLLTRNIKIQGDESSVKAQYGSHMMMTGKKENGLVASFSYIEITKCGQPKIVGRYCSHFHMTGQMPDSSVRGMAVHHSYARVLTIHGTHFLLVEKNVGYFVKGHNIFIEDGIETNNVIQDNLMISSITSLTMLQSDTSVASYWVTNPYNTFRRNHAAGSDFYGIWYEIKEHPDGPSATSDICPMGMQLGQSKDNVAHSNVRFGLRIFKLSARKYPCIDTQIHSLEDPYSANPAIESVFENYTLWQNEECGFLGQQLGFTTIRNFKTADSKKGGMQFHKTNFTKELVVAKDSIIVGFSKGNAPTNIDTTYRNARGFIASRTDGLKASGIKFYNFGATMTPLQSCSECFSMKLWVVGSKTTMFERISYTNVTGNYIFWEKWRREVFMDLDGTLLAPVVTQLGISPQASGSITPYRASLDIPSHCYEVSGPSWDHSTYCDATIQLRSILFSNAIPAIDFNAIGIKAHLLADPYENFSLTLPDQTTFSEELMIVIKPKSLDIPKSWAMPFAVNRYYNIHWKWGIDFTHVAVAPSRLWNDTEGVVLRFNYTDAREFYQIGKWYKGSLQLPFIVPSSSLIDPTTCQNGDYFQDTESKYLFLCVSGRNKKIHEWIDVNGIRCRYNCPQSATDGTREDTIRLWSDTTNWPNNVLPRQGENVTIPYEWRMVVNVPVPKLNYIEINGILMFDVNLNHTFEAHYIWVRKGIMKIGAPDAPYTNIATIVLHGEKSDDYLVLDPDASGNKMLAVTGQLQFYGNKINNVWSKLTQIASKGATSIKVISSADWKVGDKIVIAPTYSGQAQDQVVTITAISGNTVTFTPALQFEHYGASTPITNNYGVLDTRAGVGLLTRNIRITKGADQNGWGCRVLAYSYVDIPENPADQIVVRTGKVSFDGVEIDSCGQYDTTYAALRLQRLGKHQNNYQMPNIITRSSIHNSNGMGMWIANSTNVKVDNNVLHYAKKFLIYAEFVDNYTITNNLLVGAKKRPQVAGNTDQTVMVDDVACYEQYQAIDFENANVTVTNNLAQGSQTGEGFVFPFAPCDKLSTYNFGGNTAGSCTVGFMFHKIEGQQCMGASKLVGYANLIGLMANPTTSITKMIYEDVIFTDNQRGITLRYGHDSDDVSMVLRNSYFAGYSRPDCPTCYSQETNHYCRNGYAVRMFAATITGQKFPLAKKNTGFDVICTRQGYDMKSFFDNVTFENYKETNTDVPFCQDMSVFRRHDIASDSTGSAYLTNTICTNCDQNAWAWFQKPNTAWRGWFGGCGQLDCTGPNNYLIHDQDGSFTGQISQILANNSMIGQHQQTCTFNQKMNGYYCLTDKFAVLEYESIAPDFNKRIMWPVFIKYDTGNWTSTTNGWREWDWMGPEPMNQRLARFVSVVKVGHNYNLTYSSQPPSDSRFQIQKRLLPEGNENDWIIVRIYYPLPNSLQVLVKNTTGTDIIVKPFLIQNKVAVDLRNHVDTCGANNFHYENGTIEFVVNGKANCQVRVRLSNYVKINARLSIPIMDFFSNNGPTTFITNICAFLNIDPGRLKIVGVRSGSTIVDAVLTDEPESLATSTQANSNPEGQRTTLSQLATNLQTAMNQGSVSVGAEVLSVSTEIYTYNNDGTIFVPDPQPQNPEGPNSAHENEEKTKTTLIIILATVIPVIVIAVGVLGYCYMKRKRERIISINGDSNSALSDDHGMHKSKVEMIKVSEMPFQITKIQDTYDKY